MEVEPSLTATSQRPQADAVPQAKETKQRYPVMTFLCCAICIVVFLGLLNERDRDSWEALETWGYYPASRIRGGGIWAFITSVFVHLELWHVAFNVYWLYVLGARLERVIGWCRWLGFFAAAAFLSSGAEFAVSDTTGIGASGVVYAIFGYMWVVRSRHPSFQKVLDSRTIGWFFVWLIGCIAVTLTKVWEVGNAAHIVGLLFGAGIGAWSMWPERRGQLKIGFAALFLFSVIPVVWAPWSSDWTSEQGIRAYKRDDYAAAIKWYERSRTLGQDPGWCLQNIALAQFAAGEKNEYLATLDKLRKLDEKKASEVEHDVNQSLSEDSGKH